MTTFADSSTLVKLYIDEAEHEAVRSLPGLVIAQLARVEVPAALWLKRRMGVLSDDEARLLALDFQADYSGTAQEPPRFAVVSVTTAVLDAAARYTAVHGLRAYDAVQLATARAARSADPDCTRMAVFDKTLRAAGATEGFELVPPD